MEVASDDDGSVTRLWVRDGDAVSWERDGCGPSSARSIDGGDLPSDSVSLVHILIRASLERCRFFSAREISSS